MGEQPNKESSRVLRNKENTRLSCHATLHRCVLVYTWAASLSWTWIKSRETLEGAAEEKGEGAKKKNRGCKGQMTQRFA